MAAGININLEKIKESRLSEIDFENLSFGKSFSDHMLVVNYADGKWGQPQIKPFQKLSFNPSMAVLHYGQTVFEGLKAFKNADGEVLVFRPEEHAKRMNISAERVCIPELPEEIFLEGLYALLEIDNSWIPEGSNRSLYIRPVLFATDEALGVAPCKNYSFIIITSPVGAYYEGAVKVVIEQDYVRAAEGGIGYTKTAGNYAGSLYPALQAQKKGYDQLLWTDAREHKYIEEAGTMNVMFEIDGKLVTPKTTSSILDGITRKSVIDLAKKWGVSIEERRVSVEEIVEAYKAGKLTDAFGTGTAATISHISVIGLAGEDMILPPVEGRGFSNKAKDYLSNLKIGNAQDYMGWMKKTLSS
jgi:branched-chain amino acid aminotransferase